MEVEKRTFDFPTAELGLIGSSEVDGFAFRRSGRSLSCRNRAFRRLPFLHDRLQGRGGVEGAGKAAVSVKLADEFLCLREREPVVEAPVQRGGKVLLIAARNGGSEIDDGGFPDRQQFAFHIFSSV